MPIRFSPTDSHELSIHQFNFPIECFSFFSAILATLFTLQFTVQQFFGQEEAHLKFVAKLATNVIHTHTNTQVDVQWIHSPIARRSFYVQAKSAHMRAILSCLVVDVRLNGSGEISLFRWHDHEANHSSVRTFVEKGWLSFVEVNKHPHATRRSCFNLSPHWKRGFISHFLSCPITRQKSGIFGILFPSKHIFVRIGEH